MAGNRSLGTLTVDLVAKIGGFVSGMTQAERQSARTAAQIKRQQEQLARDLEKVGRQIGLGLAVGFTALSISVKKSIDDMLQIGIVAKQIGMPTEQFTALAGAARRADVDVQSLASAIMQADKALAMAQSGKGTQAQAFAALGIDPKAVKDNNDLILKAADALAQYRDGTGKTAVEMAIFGRSGAQLNQFLDQGAASIRATTDRMRELNVTFGPDAQAKLAAYDEQHKEFSDAIIGLRNRIAIALLPALTSATKYIDAMVTSMDDDAVSGFTGTINTLGRAALVVAGAFQTAGRAIGATMAIVGSAKPAVWELLSRNPTMNAASAGLSMISPRLGAMIPNRASGGGTDALKQSLADAKTILGDFASDTDKQWSALTDRIAQFGEETKKAVSAATPDGRKDLKFNPTGDTTTTGKVAADKPVRDYTEALRDQIAQLQMSTTAYRVWKAAQDGATASQQDSVRALSDQLEAIKAQQKATADMDDFLSQHRAAILGVSDAVLQFTDTTAMAQKALENGRITWEEFQRVVSQQVDELTAHTGKQTDQMSQFAIQAARNMQSSFADFLFDPFKDGLGGMVDGFATALRRMAAEMLASKVFDMLGAWGKNHSGSGGLLGILAGAMGSIGGGKAVGGYVSAGGVYPVNERGPELLTTGGRDYLMMGDAGGRVTPNSKIGGRSTTINVMVQPTSTRQTAAQTANAAARALALAEQRA